MTVLANKVAIITGASSGIGYATAKLFAREGAAVVVAARRQKELDDLADSINAEGGQALLKHSPLSLHVAGTNFQIAVWRALLKIPVGAVTSYAEVARTLGAPRSARAVGNAIGANPVALLIPCHRVIQQSGALGGVPLGSNQEAYGANMGKMRDEVVAL